MNTFTRIPGAAAEPVTRPDGLRWPFDALNIFRKRGAEALPSISKGLTSRFKGLAATRIHKAVESESGVFAMRGQVHDGCAVACSGTALQLAFVVKIIMKLFVGNLSFDTTENDLQDLFEQYGSVTEVRLVDDRMTGRSRCFAFVTFSNAAEGQAAITALDGKKFGRSES